MKVSYAVIWPTALLAGWLLLCKATDTDTNYVYTQKERERERLVYCRRGFKIYTFLEGCVEMKEVSFIFQSNLRPRIDGGRKKKKKPKF